MNTKILLLGKDGQVGWELQRALAPLGQLTEHDHGSCDVTDFKKLRQVIYDCRPDIIVNATAYTAVDKAEEESSTAFRINSEAVAVMAEMAKKQHSILVHYSTDYVFDGGKAEAYVEDDSIKPRSVYGRSKAEGERVIANSGCQNLIFRTSWVFSARGANFAKTMLQLATERDSLGIVADQWGTPTSAELIADVTAHAIRDVIAQRAPGGLYHLAASGETSWHGYANFILEQAALLGVVLKTYSARAITTGEYSLPAARPANSRLNTTKLQTTFDLRLPDWRHHVRRILIELLGNRS